MGCKAEGLKEDGCPSRFECTNLKKSDKVCSFKGDTYQLDEHFNESKAFCNVGCFCTTNDEQTTKFTCAVLDCPWGFPVQPGCYRAYDLTHCCSIKENCPSKDEPPFECEYNGEKYQEGERFGPNDACAVCLCQKGFRGKIEEPFCRRQSCDVELRYQSEIQSSCAQVYNWKGDSDGGLLCCPSDFVCSDGNEEISGTALSDEECQFGNLKLKVGQEVTKEVKKYTTTEKLNCKCQLPPLLTCTEVE